MSTKFLFRGLILSLLMTNLSCDNDDDNRIIVAPNNRFTVTIENVFEAKDYFNFGTTGLIQPGTSESFSFEAGKGHFLSFATMFVQSNDLFYATADHGLALYDDEGNAVTGDVTSMFNLWDAGTEVNEEPGVGENQAPRQSGPNTGVVENGTVELIGNVVDGFTYPEDEAVIKVLLEHDGGSKFTATIENVSAASSLPTPLAPGAWVVHNDGQKPLFVAGTAATEDLERVAEDGNNSILDESLASNSGYVSPFAPGSFGINDAVFTSGEASTEALERLAEDGSPVGFSLVFNTPDGGTSPGPIFPGNSYSFEFEAMEGDVLSFATMLVQSNDWFVGAEGIQLYNSGTPVSGDITNLIGLFDAGTEADEYAGAGNNQPVRQTGHNTGLNEEGVIEVETNPGSHVPNVSEMVKVTINPN
ncbi:Spondin_N [Arenibacter palladensis]|uniref:Spondin_N n=1 Tax=Arenibacter palladensis TaxID=237373 RepID=A0A1M4XVK7_9FLAO|nr:spondin domain-containing protein [Arenibacter palladensis]SHE97386.1 Spondin_N [Arenibacter palladensis]